MRGDVLVASAFVSYIGAFDGNSRISLVNRQWTPDLAERSVFSTTPVPRLQPSEFEHILGGNRNVTDLCAWNVAKLSDGLTDVLKHHPALRIECADVFFVYYYVW